MALLSAPKLGFLLAATGAAHFVVPDVFVELTKSAFPKDTETWVQRNGATESALGVALMLRPTRKLGRLGLVGYAGWLGFNAANAAKTAKG